MDRVHIRSLIESSPILSDDDKQYWLGVLENMKPEHYDKLENILTKAAALSAM